MFPHGGTCPHAANGLQATPFQRNRWGEPRTGVEIGHRQELLPGDRRRRDQLRGAAFKVTPEGELNTPDSFRAGSGCPAVRTLRS